MQDDALLWAREQIAKCDTPIPDDWLPITADLLAAAYRAGHAAGQSAAAERVAELEAALRHIADDHIVYHKGFGPSDGDGYVMDASEIARAALEGRQQ